MFFVGIDIAKNSHEAAIIGESGDIVVKPFKFANSLKGFEKFLAAVQGVSEDLSQFEFGMEATGHYWLNLYTKLIDFNVVVHVINPVQSDALRGLYIRKTKNDAKDAFIIAELIRFGKYSETTLSDSDLLSLRELTRQRFYLVNCVSDVKRKVISFMDKIFPEYQTSHTAKQPRDDKRKHRSRPADHGIERIRDDAECPERDHRNDERHVEQPCLPGEIHLRIGIRRKPRNEQADHKRNERHPKRVPKPHQQRRRAKIIRIDVLRKYGDIRIKRRMFGQPDELRGCRALHHGCEGRDNDGVKREEQ